MINTRSVGALLWRTDHQHVSMYKLLMALPFISASDVLAYVVSPSVSRKRFFYKIS